MYVADSFFLSVRKRYFDLKSENDSSSLDAQWHWSRTARRRTLQAKNTRRPEYRVALKTRPLFKEWNVNNEITLINAKFGAYLVNTSKVKGRKSGLVFWASDGSLRLRTTICSLERRVRKKIQSITLIQVPFNRWWQLTSVKQFQHDILRSSLSGTNCHSMIWSLTATNDNNFFNKWATERSKTVTMNFPHYLEEPRTDSLPAYNDERYLIHNLRVEKHCRGSERIKMFSNKWTHLNCND